MMKKTTSPTDASTGSQGARERLRLRRLTLRRLSTSEMNQVVGGMRIQPTAEPDECHTITEHTWWRG
jgi:hypothetical protein